MAYRSLFPRDVFAELDRLQREMALGQGESLETLAYLMGVHDTDVPAFLQLTKAHFSEIFPSDDVTAGDMLTTIARLMADDQSLSKYAAL